VSLAYKEFIDDKVIRHNVSLRNQSIIEDDIFEELMEASFSKKILVICNTVDRASEVYEKLEGAPVWLLHSRFIKKDRSKLEKQIIEFAKNTECGIWVTTQLVEASLDIDFDLLYTEMSSLDSQFQRYGRCNRKGLKPVDKVNVNVFTDNVSGIAKSGKGVYHSEIYQRSLDLLSKHLKGQLLESIKQEMIKKLYDEEDLKDTSFKKEFDKTLEELKNRPHYDYDFNKRKAQDLLRDIHQVQAIPINFTEQKEFQEILNDWSKAKTKQEKRWYRNALEAYSVGVNEFRAKNIGLTEVEGIKGLFYIHCKYSHDKGLLLKSESYFD
jgi:CRISPR-associated endonuclease/helicase Cas3